MAHRKLIQIDQSTGEVVDGMMMLVPQKTRNGFGKDWFAMCLNAAMDFAMSDMSASEYKILWAMLAHLNFENAIAAKLKMHRVTVHHCLKKLVEQGILLPDKQRSCAYRLNPNYAWRGSGKNHRAALAGHLKLSS
jgi:biotin operon repressor